jgi:hypothetical protein
MTLQAVNEQLCAMADRSDWKAQIARDSRQAARHAANAMELRALQRIVADAVVQLDSYRQAAEIINAPRVKASPRKKAAPAAPAKEKPIHVLDFWRLHSLAVAAITARYPTRVNEIGFPIGPGWSCRAKQDETILVGLPSAYRNYTTERGQKIRWAASYRMPAAQFWPDGVLPPCLDVSPSYDHCKVDANGKAVDSPRDETAWHLAHGYVRTERGWEKEILVRTRQSRDAQIAANYGLQPLLAEPEAA